MSVAEVREKRLKRLSQIKLWAFLMLVLGAFVLILTVENLLLSSVLGFVIAYLCGPWVNSLERTGLDRIYATALVFALIGGVVFFTIYLSAPFVADQLSSLKTEVPKYIDGVTRMLVETEKRLQLFSAETYTIDISGRVERWMVNSTEGIFQNLPKMISKSLTVLLLAPFLAFFMIKDGRNINRTLLTLVPNSVFEVTLNLYHQINDQMGQFVRARLLEATIVGLVTFIGLVILGFPYAAFLAIFAALTNLIPYVGPIIGAVPALLIAMVNGSPTLEIVLVSMVYAVAQLIDIVFIIPLVVAKIVDLHPVAVVIAIIVGAQIMGILGMIISIPVASALKVTFGTLYQHMTDDRV